MVFSPYYLSLVTSTFYIGIAFKIIAKGKYTQELNPMITYENNIGQNPSM